MVNLITNKASDFGGFGKKMMDAGSAGCLMK